MSDSNALLTVQNIKKYFKGTKGCQVKAVDDISFSVARGETLGLVGESGCGKSTLGRTILNLVDATEGGVIYGGKDILKLPQKEVRLLRK